MCTNEWSPADGRVVHLGYGCGSHSQTGQADEDRETQRAAGVIVDELDVELEKTVPAEETPADETPAEETPSEETPAEDTAAEDAPTES